MATRARITKPGKENGLQDRFEEVHGRRIIRYCRESGMEEEKGKVKTKEGKNYCKLQGGGFRPNAH